MLRLIHEGADIHTGYDYPIRYAAQNGHLQVVKILLVAGARVDNESFNAAVEEGHLEVAQELLRAGAKPYVDVERTLQRTVENGHLNTVKFVLQKLHRTSVPQEFLSLWSSVCQDN